MVKNVFGYNLVYIGKNNPRAYSNGYALQHRLVMEEKLGRFLQEDEIVHHINEIKNDNRVENLELTTRKNHIKHHKDIVTDRATIKKISKKTCHRGHGLFGSNLYLTPNGRRNCKSCRKESSIRYWSKKLAN